jgi:hypothetical protein
VGRSDHQHPTDTERRAIDPESRRRERLDDLTRISSTASIKAANNRAVMTTLLRSSISWAATVWCSTQSGAAVRKAG